MTDFNELPRLPVISHAERPSTYERGERALPPFVALALGGLSEHTLAEIRALPGQFPQVRSAVSGPQGTLANVGVYLPLPLDAAVELTVLPTLTWANGREMRTFYGITAEQSTTTGFAAYRPSAGWENAALEVAGDWKIGSGGHLLASVAYQRLLGNAAASPLIQTRNQTSAFAGAAWNF